MNTDTEKANKRNTPAAGRADFCEHMSTVLIVGDKFRK